MPTIPIYKVPSMIKDLLKEGSPSEDEINKLKLTVSEIVEKYSVNVFTAVFKKTISYPEVDKKEILVSTLFDHFSNNKIDRVELLKGYIDSCESNPRLMAILLKNYLPHFSDEELYPIFKMIATEDKLNPLLNELFGNNNHEANLLSKENGLKLLKIALKHHKAPLISYIKRNQPELFENSKEFFEKDFILFLESIESSKNLDALCNYVQDFLKLFKTCTLNLNKDEKKLLKNEFLKIMLGCHVIIKDKLSSNKNIDKEMLMAELLGSVFSNATVNQDSLLTQYLKNYNYASNPNVGANLIEIYLRTLPIQNISLISDFLVSNKKNQPVIESLFDNIKENDRPLYDLFFSELFKKALKHYNAPLVLYIKNEKYPLFKNALKSLDGKLSFILNGIESYKNPEMLFKYMKESDEFGKLTYKGGVLTAAQIGSRKKYEFNPTILNENEISNYFEIIKNADRPVRERFIMTGVHWISGEISIDKDNNVNILFIDSLGKYEGAEISFSESSMRECLKVFSSMSPTIYFDPTKRQNSLKGCSVFALDDLQHLFTVDDFLPSQYKNIEGGLGLFNYLKDNSYKIVNSKNNTFNFTKLPLYMMKATQSTNLLNTILPGRSTEEQEAVISRKKELPYDNLKKSFVINAKTKKLYNSRLENKLNKIRDYNFQYLLSNSSLKDSLLVNLEKFKLSGFEKRMNSSEIRNTKKPRKF